MLDLKISKKYRDFELDVSVHSNARVTALFGPSGAGKSSILNMVAGLVRPDHGFIKLGGQVLFDSKKQINLTPQKRQLGFVFQDSKLFPHLDVRRNLTYAQWAGKRKSNISFERVVEVLNISHLVDRMPANLSGGEKQRVAIGRALLADPRLLLLDEPMASLDMQRRAQLLEFIRSVGQEFDIPMLFVSHDLDDVAQLAEDIVLIEAGRVAASGELGAVLALPESQNNIGIQQSSTVLKGSIIGVDDAYGINNVGLSEGADQNDFICFSGRGHQVGDKVRLRVKSRDVALAISKPKQTSLQNCISVTVQNTEELRTGQMRVKCELQGQQIYSHITKKSYDELNLAENRQVYALIKAVSLI